MKISILIFVKLPRKKSIINVENASKENWFKWIVKISLMEVTWMISKPKTQKRKSRLTRHLRGCCQPSSDCLFSFYWKNIVLFLRILSSDLGSPSRTTSSPTQYLDYEDELSATQNYKYCIVVIDDMWDHRQKDISPVFTNGRHENFDVSVSTKRFCELPLIKKLKWKEVSNKLRKQCKCFIMM